MPYEHDPSMVKTDKDIKNYIRASYYTGDVNSTGWRKHLDVLKISWSRFWFVFVGGESGHAYVDIFVEQAQLLWGQEKGYKRGHIAAYLSVVVLVVLFMSLVVWLYNH